MKYVCLPVVPLATLSHPLHIFQNFIAFPKFQLKSHLHIVNRKLILVTVAAICSVEWLLCILKIGHYSECNQNIIFTAYFSKNKKIPPPHTSFSGIITHEHFLIIFKGGQIMRAISWVPQRLPKVKFR